MPDEETEELKFKEEGSDEELTLGEILDKVMHEPQPHTDMGKRGEHIVSGITIRQIAECVIRGMLDGATEYDKPTEQLDLHHLYHIIYKVKWIKDFDPVAIQQNTTCHIEKVLGIYPNIPKITKNSS